MAPQNDSTSLHIPQFDCPTLKHLNVDASLIDATSPLEQASKWLSKFETSVSGGDPNAIASLFHQDGYWKDILALTWDFRTIRSHAPIKRMLSARLAPTGLSAFCLIEDAIRGPEMIKPIPDLLFVRFSFEFETTHGTGIAVVFLVPTSNGAWTAWSLLTRLHSLKAHQEKIGASCAQPSVATRENWEDLRRREIDFENGDPMVLVIGAGHCGLEVAARLKFLGIPTLLVDRNKRIGNNWRTRYKTLSLHDTRWFNRMPYLDFPTTWPLYCPASKLGDWLECYATTLDLNVWVSSTVISAKFDQDTKTWQICIDRASQTRTMVVKHVVFATGFGYPNMPDIPGKDVYRGSILHSTKFSSATDFEERRRLLSAQVIQVRHDIAHDFCIHGWDVTMIQRSPVFVASRNAVAMSLEGNGNYNDQFPVEFADVLGVALPLTTRKCLLKVATARTANGIDKELLDNLATAGFQTYLGPDGTGLATLILERAGGIYIDTGACQEIINGAIKVTRSSTIRNFTEDGVELEDATILEGDVVVFATGFGDFRHSIREVCGEKVYEKVGKVWGLDAEGELQGVWRRTGHPRLWFAVGNLGRSRLHSLHLALQIKAIEEGIVGDETICVD